MNGNPTLSFCLNSARKDERMNNGKEIAELKTLYQEGHREIILVTLHLAGISDQLLDYISDGLWSERQAIISIDLPDKYKKEDAG